jgi:hypothetical protein
VLPPHTGTAGLDGARRVPIPGGDARVDKLVDRVDVGVGLNVDGNVKTGGTGWVWGDKGDKEALDNDML